MNFNYKQAVILSQIYEELKQIQPYSAVQDKALGFPKMNDANQVLRYVDTATIIKRNYVKYGKDTKLRVHITKYLGLVLNSALINFSEKMKIQFSKLCAKRNILQL